MRHNQVNLTLVSGHKYELNQYPDAKINTLVPKNRIIVILIDSLPYKKFFSVSMPFVSSLQQKSAWGTSQVMSTPLSIAGDHAIFAGQITNFLTIFEDFSGKTSKYDNLFKRVTANGDRAIIISSHCLRGAYKNFTDDDAYQKIHFGFREYKKDAKYHYEQALKVIRNSNWDFLVIQFVAMDFVGHLYTPGSSEYDNMLQVIDQYVKEILQFTKPSDYILITSEHGMDDSGFHVDLEPDVTNTPFLIMGPLIKVQGPITVSQIDWAPTLSILANVTPYYNSPAIPILPILNLSQSHSNLIIGNFADYFNQKASVTTYNELLAIREKLITSNFPKYYQLIVFLCTVLFLGIFLFSSKIISPFKMKNFVYSLIILIGLWLLLFYFRIHFAKSLDFNIKIPFSANFILLHPYITLLIGFSILIFTGTVKFISDLLSNEHKPIFQLILIQIILVIIYLLPNPQHPLNWLLLFLPFTLAIFSKNKDWLVIAVTFIIALLIRRLTFFTSIHTFKMPGRGIILTAILLISIIYRLRNKSFSKVPYLEILFIPLLLVRSFSNNVYIIAAIGIVTLLPLILINNHNTKIYLYGLALWTTMYYVAVSGNIFHLTHLVILPLYVSIWNISSQSDDITAGWLLVLTLWLIFFIPGNTISLKIS